MPSRALALRVLGVVGAAAVLAAALLRGASPMALLRDVASSRGGTSHVDAPLADPSAALPDNFPELREFPSWTAWLDYRRALDSTPSALRPRRRVVPIASNGSSSANGSLPLFVVAGVQKGGTTFLRNLMAMHPMLSAGRGYVGYVASTLLLLLLTTLRPSAAAATAAAAPTTPAPPSLRYYSYCYYFYPTTTN